MRKFDIEDMGNVDLEELVKKMSKHDKEDIIPSSDEDDIIEYVDSEEDEDIKVNEKDAKSDYSEMEDAVNDLDADNLDENLYDSDTIKALINEYKELKKENEELNDKYIRTLADFGNFRKRNHEENRQNIAKGKVSLLKEVILLNDTLVRAIEHSSEDQNFENLFEGVNILQKMVELILSKENVKIIEAVGEKFNPDLHECVLITPVPDMEPETIIEETEKGYILGKTVIRPAKVIVSQ